MRRMSLITVPSANKEHRGSLTGREQRGSISGPAGYRRKSSAKEIVGLSQLDNKMWSNAIGKSMGLIPGRDTFGPLFLITVSPTFVMLLHHILVHLDGSLVLFMYEIRDHGIFGTILGYWMNHHNLFVWKMIAIFMLIELSMIKLIPAKTYKGPVTPAGNTPVYNANGLQAYFLTIALFLGGIYLGLYNGGIIFDHMAQILSSMNVFALTFCAFLYLKGKYFPSSTDCGSTGNVIFDFYWGTELYPKILGWDVKQFTNCRCGMMFWPLFILSCTFKQYEMHGTIADSMIINVALQLIYITKFYAWETGYLSSMDIMHDRAGFYICWGVLVFLPCVYTSHTMYLVDNPNELGWFLAGLIFAAGVLAIYVNYDCDRQRQNFRTDHGRRKIWGKDPVFIEAKYKTESGDVKTSLLLASGWWGISRHFHYLPEILAATAWTIPVWCKEYLPYFYIPYLILLLTDRAFRDDARCRCKYGKYWEQYCYHVPYMLIKGIV